MFGKGSGLAKSSAARPVKLALAGSLRGACGYLRGACGAIARPDFALSRNLRASRLMKNPPLFLNYKTPRKRRFAFHCRGNDDKVGRMCIIPEKRAYRKVSLFPSGGGSAVPPWPITKLPPFVIGNACNVRQEGRCPACGATIAAAGSPKSTGRRVQRFLVEKPRPTGRIVGNTVARLDRRTAEGSGGPVGILKERHS